ncbi:hypothetical protein BESB_068560 [Besnoitia besnoiti]|uniref:FAS1 domain-containing protein n=1 Tax=Besnoitia besnoiti TaxID=94643 RepID=A0A2A9MGP0_BESBE|nr:hypothetical protein BESB_068560 [Besnoitia besnoiti]PFH34823.1 hypothetical protein BESB_068560 [Besnoitia besnoiti]
MAFLPQRSFSLLGRDSAELFLGLQLQQRRWWTRASGMRSPVKWSRDWEVLNRKVYFAFDEREVRRSLLDAVSAHRKSVSIFYRLINVVPGVAHTLSLPGPHTFLLPTDEACRAHLSAATLDALNARLAFLEDQQTQRLASSRSPLEGGALTASRGGTAAVTAARVVNVTEQLRALALSHVIPGEWRLKTLMLACGAGDPRAQSSWLHQDSVGELITPVMYASRLGGSASPRGRRLTRGTAGAAGQGAKDALDIQGDAEAGRRPPVAHPVFSLPPALSAEEPLRVWVEPSRYAALLPITTSTNFAARGAIDADSETSHGTDEGRSAAHAVGARRFARVGGALNLWIGGALVLKGDLRSHNGVVHLIDKPLVPKQLLASST